MMRNKRFIIALTGAILCGLIAVMLVTRYLSNVQAYAKDLGTVVVAKTEIRRFPEIGSGRGPGSDHTDWDTRNDHESKTRGLGNGSGTFCCDSRRLSRYDG